MKEQNNSFWLTLPNPITIKVCAETEDPENEILDKIYQIEERDQQKMNQLQVEKQFYEKYGITSFISHLKNFSITKIKEHLPDVRKNFNLEIIFLEKKISDLKIKLLRSTDQNEARKNILSIVCSFCDKISSIVSASVMLNPKLFGKDSIEECEGNYFWLQLFKYFQF